MMRELNNPFDLTAATHLTDDQILRYWVNFPNKIVNTRSPRPLLILGGKGSGKTHLMRHLSFQSQQREYKGDVVKGLQKDGYIGLYFRCGGLNAFRFQGKSTDQEKWKIIYTYFMELWFGELMLQSAIIAFSTLHSFTQNQHAICNDISRLFDKFPFPVPEKMDDLLQIFRQLQKEVNVSVNNRAIGKEFDFEILVTAGNLSLGIAPIFLKYCTELSKIKFIYLIDELENLTAYQQSYIHTLIRERYDPVTFYVGSRLYGIKTYQTLSANEENKPGSEFDLKVLDTLLRDNKKEYSDFAKKLCQKRLAEAGYHYVDIETILDTETDEERIKKLREKSGTNLPPHFLSLQSKLKENNIPDGKLTPQQIKSIIENLIHPSDAIVEKANIFLLYQYWSSGTTLLSASRKIKTECKKYLEKKGSKTAQKRIIDYYRTDLIAQLYKDFNTAQPYANFDTFLEMSEGLPRNLLIILSNIFNWAIFYGEKPFLTEKPISERAQLSAVKESTDWFLKDVSIFGDEGVSMLNSVKRLGNFFREIRYSDKPGECSLITFSYSTGSIRDESVVNLIDLAVRWSLLIRIPKGQKHKNSKSKTEKVQLSKMLSPYWDLSIARRGTIPLTGEDINCIFKGSEESFESLLKTKTEGMMTPFGYKKKILSTLKNEAKILNASKNPSLFEK